MQAHGFLSAEPEETCLFQLDAQMTLVSEGQEAREKLERRLEEEREKHKAMVSPLPLLFLYSSLSLQIMFLINERKQLLIRLHEMRLKQEPTAAEPSPAAQDVLIEQMRQEIKCLRQERDAFKNESKNLKVSSIYGLKKWEICRARISV